jgi:hypothetical protein
MNSNDNEHGPGAKAILGIVSAVSAGLMLWAIQNGFSAAFFIFLMLLVWTVGVYTRFWNPWIAVIVAAIGWFAWGVFH